MGEVLTPIFTSRSKLTRTVLMVSVPSDSCYEVKAGKSCHEALKTMTLATV